MATAARSAPSLEFTAAPDAMDLHSDSGYDFGDGDLDLDLRSPGRQDDDVSLRDAGADADLDVQTAPADQDDFMADNEDIIDEDAITYDDDAVIVIEQNSTYNADEEQQAPASVEEDLIDYSDDEVTPAWNDNTNAQDLDNIPTEDNDIEHAVAEETFEDAAQAVNEAPVEDYDDEDGYYGGDADHTGQDLHGEANSPVRSLKVNSEHGSPAERDASLQQEHNVYTHDDAESHTGLANNDEQVKVQDGGQGQLEVSDNSRAKASANDEADQVQQDALLHPVTVNYDGAELWLFKHHDFDDSGDYLIEDSSLGRQPVSNLLDACRTALGSDVTDDMELGFRLDHFHNIELYQDHSSCAFVTLEHIINLYLQLHSQDGNVNPDSFYMTLLFRPRVSALLNELNKAAADGIGHSGLDSAIAAGQTAFNAHFSHQSTEQVYEDWEDSEHQHEQKSYNENGEVEKGDLEGEYHEEHDEEQHEERNFENDEEHNEEKYEERKGDDAPRSKAQSPFIATPAIQADSADTTARAGDSAAVENTGSASQQLADRSRSNSQSQPQEEDDFVDYSDDEADKGDVDVTKGEQSQPNQASSSSSTVQGDDTSYGQDNVQGLADQDEFAEGDVEATFEFQEGETNEAFAQHGGFDYNQEGFDGLGYDALNEQYDPEYEHELIEAQELEGYPTQYAPQANDENTNHYDAFGDHAVDQPTDLGLSGSGGDDFAQASTVDDFIGADDFLDLDNAAQAANDSVNDQVGGSAKDDEINYDDEDGADGQAPVSASAAAEPVVTSSTGLQNLSPQGQKRTIDEVGNDVGQATDSSDAKRPRV